jgi:proline iminopeptidase
MVRLLFQNRPDFLTLSSREEYIAPVPEAERDDFVKAYNKLLNSEDKKVRLNAAKAWSKWE